MSYNSSSRNTGYPSNYSTGSRSGITGYAGRASDLARSSRGFPGFTSTPMASNSTHGYATMSYPSQNYLATAPTASIYSGTNFPVQSSSLTNFANSQAQSYSDLERSHLATPSPYDSAAYRMTGPASSTQTIRQGMPGHLHASSVASSRIPATLSDATDRSRYRQREYGQSTDTARSTQRRESASPARVSDDSRSSPTRRSAVEISDYAKELKKARMALNRHGSNASRTVPEAYSMVREHETIKSNTLYTPTPAYKSDLKAAKRKVSYYDSEASAKVPEAYEFVKDHEASIYSLHPADLSKSYRKILEDRSRSAARSSLTRR